MRFSLSHTMSASTTIITAILTLSSIVSANPYPRLASESPVFEVANALQIRECAFPCGYYGQACCGAAGQCMTNAANEAVCGTGGIAAPTPGAGAGGATVTVTVFGAAPTAATCNVQLGQQQCGSTCCNAGQFCNSGVCMNNGATTGAVVGVTVSAPTRPTSISTYTVMVTNGVTSTVPFLMPATATSSPDGVTTTTSGSSLSGGAIAGIVIGVLAGIIILILIIICCCARGVLDLIRPKRKTEVTEIYEGHHHAGGSTRPPKKRFGIFGGGGGGSNHGEKKKGWAGIAGILAAVALVLGLKRRHDRKHEEKESTAYTYSDYTYDYSTSASSESSDDRRTRHTDRSRSDRRSRR